ncbi:MAG: hypothetical protein V3U75_06715 [Methylococcaceae bacterium]
MVYTAISFFIITVLFLIIGSINPAWVFFWQKKPERVWVVGIAAVMLMGTLTLYGEGLRRKQENQEAAATPTNPPKEASKSQNKDLPTPGTDLTETVKPTK